LSYRSPQAFVIALTCMKVLACTWDWEITERNFIALFINKGLEPKLVYLKPDMIHLKTLYDRRRSRKIEGSVEYWQHAIGKSL